ncbi:MAG: putative nucleotidyltransferase substrate binding domain-containing protein [Sedimenticola sp.]
MIQSAEKLSIEQVLSGTRSFNDVSLETISLLVSESESRMYTAGSALFFPGDPYQKVVYVLLQGCIVMHRPSGRQDRVLPGDFVGLANYLDGNDHSTKAEVTRQSKVLRIPEPVLQRLEHERPDLFNALNRVIAAKLRERSPDRSISTGILAQPVTRIMKSPVSSCGPETTIADSLALLQERQIGSLAVTNEKGTLQGLLTFAGLAEAVISNGAKPEDSVLGIACETPHIVDSDTPLWEAQELLKRQYSKYLLVVDASAPIGMVTQSDILRVLISRPSILTSRLREADSMKELISLATRIIEAAVDAQKSNHRPSDAVRLLSETHLIIQRRAIELTLRWMERKGLGKPPVEFAVLVMGSGGRREMLLNPDQDNALILQDVPEKELKAAEEWFARFTKRMNRNLARVGYALCPGEIMACNPRFRKTLSGWKKALSRAIRQPTAKSARWSNVMLDFDTLYGNDTLTSELKQHLLSETSSNPQLFKFMAEDDAEGKPAIGFFNQLLTTSNDKGQWIDIKRNGLRIIADATRIYALDTGIAVQNTSDRLEALLRAGRLSKDFTDAIQEAYEELLDLLLSHQIEQHGKSQKPDKQIDPTRLSRQSRSTLRMAMRAVKRFQQQLQGDYGVDV